MNGPQEEAAPGTREPRERSNLMGERSGVGCKEVAEVIGEDTTERRQDCQHVILRELKRDAEQQGDLKDQRMAGMPGGSGEQRNTVLQGKPSEQKEPGMQDGLREPGRQDGLREPGRQDGLGEFREPGMQRGLVVPELQAEWVIHESAVGRNVKKLHVEMQDGLGEFREPGMQDGLGEFREPGMQRGLVVPELQAEWVIHDSALGRDGKTPHVERGNPLEGEVLGQEKVGVNSGKQRQKELKAWSEMQKVQELWGESWVQDSQVELEIQELQGDKDGQEIISHFQWGKGEGQEPQRCSEKQELWERKGERHIEELVGIQTFCATIKTLHQAGIDGVQDLQEVKQEARGYGPLQEFSSVSGSQQYAQILTTDSSTEVKDLEDSIEEMLVRLDEFCAMIDIVRKETSQILEEKVPAIKTRVEEMNRIYSQVDKLEAFVKMVGHHVSFMEEEVAQAESAGLFLPQAIKRVLQEAPMPSFLKKRALNKQRPYELPKLYRTEDYFPLNCADPKKPH